MNTKKIPIDLMVFDMDGTLTNSIPSAIKAVQEMMKELGFPYKTEEEIGIHVGYGEIPLVSGAVGTKDPETLNKALNLYLKLYKEKFITQIPIYPHVKETIEYFKDKRKAIISNKDSNLIKIILDNYNLTQYFDKIFGGDNAPCLKPDPCAIVKIMNENKISKEKTLFVGDMTVDIETGKNAGVLTCAVTYGFDHKEKLINSKPDFLIDDIWELTGIAM